MEPIATEQDASAVLWRITGYILSAAEGTEHEGLKKLAEQSLALVMADPETLRKVLIDQANAKPKPEAQRAPNPVIEQMLARRANSQPEQQLQNLIKQVKQRLNDGQDHPATVDGSTGTAETPAAQ